jgi:hypothetical protein
MTGKARRLRLVPTGPDVEPQATSTVPQAPATPAELLETVGWPLPVADLSSLTPNDVQALMDRIDEFGRHRFQTARPPHSTRQRPRRAQRDVWADLDEADLDHFDPADPIDLPRDVADLFSRSLCPPGSALPELLSRIDFSSSISLAEPAADHLAHRFSWLLNRVGSDGLALTSAGYLKPHDVSAAVADFYLDLEWPGAGKREAHALPVRWLRESAQRLGLVRKLNGRLLATRAGAAVANDPVALLDWIARRLPLGRSPVERDAGLALLLVVAAGGTDAGGSIDFITADVLTGAGWQAPDGGPIDAMMVGEASAMTGTVLRQLGAIESLPAWGRPAVSPEGAEFARLALTVSARQVPSAPAR